MVVELKLLVLRMSQGVIMKRSYDDCDPDSVTLPEQRLPFSRVRLPPKSCSNGGGGVGGAASPVTTFTADQEIEVFSSPGESEVGGWWRASIKVSFKKWQILQFWCRNNVGF